MLVMFFDQLAAEADIFSALEAQAALEARQRYVDVTLTATAQGSAKPPIITLK